MSKQSEFTRSGTVDEYKIKYGERSLSDFWEIKSIIKAYEIPAGTYVLIDDTVKRLNRIYIPFAMLWVIQKKREIWKEMLKIEESINIAFECGNEEYLKETLKMYYEIWVRIIEEFKPMKDKFIPF